MAKVTAPNPIREIGTQTRLLTCKLNDTELLERGAELAKIIQDLDTEEATQASLRQELKSRLLILEARRSGVAAKIARREETREVSVRMSLNFDRDVYTEVRTDTGEEIKVRPINDEERQTALDLPGKGA